MWVSTIYAFKSFQLIKNICVISSMLLADNSVTIIINEFLYR